MSIRVALKTCQGQAFLFILPQLQEEENLKNNEPSANVIKRFSVIDKGTKKAGVLGPDMLFHANLLFGRVAGVHPCGAHYNIPLCG
jgi:hypothetical protein